MLETLAALFLGSVLGMVICLCIEYKNGRL